MQKVKLKKGTREEVTEEEISKPSPVKLKEGTRQKISEDEYLTDTDPTIIDKTSSMIGDIVDDPMTALKSAGETVLSMGGDALEGLDAPYRAVKQGAVEGWQEGRGLKKPFRALGNAFAYPARYYGDALFGESPKEGQPYTGYIPESTGDTLKRSGLYGKEGLIGRDPHLVEEIAVDIALDPAGAIRKVPKLIKGGINFASRMTPVVRHVPIVGEGIWNGVKETKNFYTSALKGEKQLNSERMKKIADRLDIPNDELPKAVEWGKESVDSIVERMKNDLLVDPQHLKKMQKNIELVKKDTLRQARSYGNADSLHSLGGNIRNRIEDVQDNLWKVDEPTYNRLALDPKFSEVQAPREAVDELFKFLGDAKDDLDMNFNSTLKQAQETKPKVIAELNHMRESFLNFNLVTGTGTNATLRNLVIKLKGVGSQLNDFKADSLAGVLSDQDKFLRKHYSTLYGKLKNAISETVNTVDPDEAMKLAANNEKTTMLIDSLKKMTGNKLTDDFSDLELAQKFLTSLTRYGKEVPEQLFGKQLIGDTKSAWLIDHIIKPSMMDEAEFSVKQMASKFKQPKAKEIIKVLFDDDPKALSNIFDNARLLDSMGPIGFNTSGTARMNLLTHMLSATKSITTLNVLESYLKHSAATHRIPYDLLDNVIIKGGKAYGKAIMGGSFKPFVNDKFNKDFIYPIMRQAGGLKHKFEENEKQVPLSFAIPDEAKPEFMRILKDDKELGSIEKLERKEQIERGEFIFMIDKKLSENTRSMEDMGG